jgi:hypothetical protein
MTLASTTGCPPGTLEDPERFEDAGDPTCPIGYDVPRDLFKKKCVDLCHDDNDPDAELDLETAGVASRLIGVASTDKDCGARLLIDPASPDQSFLLEKLENKSPQCGEQMPNTLKKASQGEIDCVRQWVYGLVGGGSDSGAGGTAGSAGADSGGGD